MLVTGRRANGNLISDKVKKKSILTRYRPVSIAVLLLHGMNLKKKML